MAFDPRGTGKTIPIICVEDGELDTVNMYDYTRLDPERSPDRLWAASKIFADRCKRTEADTAPFIGTAAVARDLISVVDALDEDGMLRYWGKTVSRSHSWTTANVTLGFSYGIALGAIVAAMFPNRIDRILLDGNVNLPEYYNSFADFEAWDTADGTFSAIWSHCIDAGADLCPLAKYYNDSTILEEEIWNLLDSTVSHPIVVTGANASVALDYNLLKQLYIAAVYGEQDWHNASMITAMLLRGESDNDDLYNLLDHSLPLTAEENEANYMNKVATLAIRAADRVPRSSNMSDIEPLLKQIRNMSTLVGDASDADVMVCAQWPFEPPERYSGPWAGIRTPTPMLLLGNTFDPVTPLTSAYNTSAAFEGSAVLEIDTYGHTSLAAVSECVDNALQAYFVNGALPLEKTYCENEVAPYRMKDD